MVARCWGGWPRAQEKGHLGKMPQSKIKRVSLKKRNAVSGKSVQNNLAITGNLTPSPPFYISNGPISSKNIVVAMLTVVTVARPRSELQMSVKTPFLKPLQLYFYFRT